MNFSSNKYFSKVIYSDTYVMQKSQMDKSEVDKLEQAIEVHGYRGASKKKHNGVVPIRPDDKELWKSLKKFKEGAQLEHSELLEFFADVKVVAQLEHSELLEFFADVKVVAHVENGNRAIGTIYKNNNGDLLLYLLGFANYNYQ